MILDLHVHSKYSFDSILTPQKIIETAQARGLNGIGITDHNTIRGGIEAQKINRAPNLLIIVGVEMSTEAGDLVGLFLKEEIRDHHSIRVADEIHRQGGIVVLPHPYEGHRLNDELLKKVDLVEGFNARASERANKKAVELAEKWNKPITAGSDAHFAAEIGLARTIVDGSDMDNIQSAILNNKIMTTCIQTRSYWPLLSQIIKSIKMREYQKIPLHLAGFIKSRLVKGT